MKNKLILLISIACIYQTCVAQVFTQKSDFIEPRHRAFSLILNNKLITGTGRDASGTMNNQVWEYDIATQQWNPLNDFPTNPVRNCISMVINDTAYAGFGRDGTNGIGWYQYNAGSDTWVQKNSGGNASSFSGTFSLNGKGYAVCGSGALGEHSELWEYNPATDAWLQKANFPGAARDFPFADTVGGFAYAGMGDFFFAPPWFSDMYKYDAIADTWTSIAPIPVSSTGAIAEGGCSFSASYNGKLIIMSLDGIKTTQLSDYNTIYVYDPSTDSWTLYENANPVGSRGTPLKGQNGSKAYFGCGDDFINGIKQDFWEVDLALFLTSIHEQNPGLENIEIYAAKNKIFAKIPPEVLVLQNLALEIYTIDGKLIATHCLQWEQSFDVSNLTTGNYVYVLKSEKRNLKSGKLLLN
jgi:N-acetylneuraminic acid mutarotase